MSTSILLILSGTCQLVMSADRSSVRVSADLIIVIFINDFIDKVIIILFPKYCCSKNNMGRTKGRDLGTPA